MMKFNKEEIDQLFIKLIADEQNLDPAQIAIDVEFYTYGLDSISAIHVLDKLEDQLGIEINPLDFWDYPTIDQFSNYLLEKRLI